MLEWVFFFQAEDGIRDLVRSRGLGDVYKRQDMNGAETLVRTLLASDVRVCFANPGTSEMHFVALSLIHI